VKACSLPQPILRITRKRATKMRMTLNSILLTTSLKNGKGGCKDLTNLTGRDVWMKILCTYFQAVDSVSERCESGLLTKPGRTRLPWIACPGGRSFSINVLDCALETYLVDDTKESQYSIFLCNVVVIFLVTTKSILFYISSARVLYAYIIYISYIILYIYIYHVYFISYNIIII
jgi:hypothetical protein